MSRPENAASEGLRETTTVAIIGAGFGGVCAAIRLKQLGIPFVVLEKAASVGGVWRDNTYPGAACDVPSHLYSFSFEPSADWSRRYGTQPEIQSYIERTAHRYGVSEMIRFGAEVKSAEFDDDRGRWLLKLGEGSSLEARFLVAATGQLSQPAVPRIPGLDDFDGPVFHSARWDHDVELEDKRVAVLGTGASAIQFVPQIVPRVATLDLYQRSAPYILPKPDRSYSMLERFLFSRFPVLQTASRAAKYLRHEARSLPLVRGIGAAWVSRMAMRYLDKEVQDPELRRRLTPDYPIGCKRVLISNDWYRALSDSKVSVVNTDVQEVRGNRIVTADGTEREVDAVILGTGFRANDFLAPIDITGRNGRKLAAAWKDGAEAYLGISVSGFPNLFVLYGPNTNLGHNSIVYMIERQVEHALAAIQHIKASGRAYVEVLPGIQDEFNQDLQAALKETVWEAGCRSWYRTAEGKNTNNWPGFTFEYAKRARDFDPVHYEVVTPGE